MIKKYIHNKKYQRHLNNPISILFLFFCREFYRFHSCNDCFTITISWNKRKNEPKHQRKVHQRWSPSVQNVFFQLPNLTGE